MPLNAAERQVKVAQPFKARTFRVKVTNVGDDTDTYSLSDAFPAGMTGTFESASVTVLPGLGNFREVELTVVPRALRLGTIRLRSPQPRPKMAVSKGQQMVQST